jgi:hypothetical protein
MKTQFKLLLVALSLINARHGSAADKPSEFSNAVTKITQDWEAEDWKNNKILLHPSRYNEYSDVFLNLLPEEKASGRTAQDVLKYYYEGTTVDTNGGDKPVDISAATEVGPGLLVATRKWTHGFTDLIGFWGVVSTKAGTFIPYTAQCQLNKQDNNEFSDVCMKKFVMILTYLQAGALKMPETGILPIAGWEDSYGKDGMILARRTQFTGIRTYSPSTIRISPPVTLTAEQLPLVLDGFAAAMMEDDDLEDNYVTRKMVGTPTDPWAKRQYPVKFKTELTLATYMAGTARLPDGRMVLVGVRCINESWQSTCNYGVESARRLIKDGATEQKRLAIIEAGKVPIPPNGIKNEQIFGLYQSGDFMGVFLKDGTYTDDFDKPPATTIAAKSKVDEPSSWGTWRQVGANIIATDSDGDKQTIAIGAGARLIPGTPTTRLKGYFGTVSSWSNGINMGGGVSRSGYEFYADGTVEHSSSSSFSVSAYLPNGDFGPQQVAAGGSSSSNRARYEINGYMLTITYPDGRQMRKAFGIPAYNKNTAQPSTVMIGGGIFNLDGGE